MSSKKKFKVCKEDLITKAVRRRYYFVKAETREEAEKLVEEDEHNNFDSDIEILESSHLNYQTEEK